MSEFQKKQMDILTELRALKKPRASVTTHASAGALIINSSETVDPSSLLSLSAAPVPQEVLAIVAGWENCQNEDDLQAGWSHRYSSF